jgi:gliding motility-associated-like protein
MKKMHKQILGNRCAISPVFTCWLLLSEMGCSAPKVVQQNEPLDIENLTCQWDVLEVPSAFSPNGDGVNDVWKPIFRGDVEDLHVRVIGKFGEFVFESKEKTFQWSGTDTKGREMEAGLYGFVIDYQQNGTRQQCKGALTLLR